MVWFILYKLNFKPRGNSSHETVRTVTFLFAAAKQAVQAELRTKLREAETLEYSHSHDNIPNLATGTLQGTLNVDKKWAVNV